MWQFFFRDLTTHFDHLDFELNDENLDESYHQMKKFDELKGINQGDEFTIMIQEDRVSLTVNGVDCGVIIEDKKIL